MTFLWCSPGCRDHQQDRLSVSEGCGIQMEASPTDNEKMLRGTMRILRFVFILVLAATLSPLVEAQNVPTAVTIPLTEVHNLTSDEIGQEFKIYVALPFSYGGGDQLYPVLYVLDADFGFGMSAEYARLLALGAEVQEMILVGIGYGTANPQQWQQLRTRDLTPTSGARNPSALAAVAAQGTEAVVPPGGAAAFLTFIREDLQPFIDSHYRTVPDQSGIFGDSFGGLFSLYALFHEPATFSKYIIGSPSIWWDGEVTLEFEEQYAVRHADLDVEIFMAVGRLEEATTVKDDRWPSNPMSDSASSLSRMVSNVDEIARRLRSRAYPNLELSTHVFDGETHLSVLPANFGWGIRWLYGPKR
jgi:predicted alpha/beta superfamily hydrolase